MAKRERKERQDRLSRKAQQLDEHNWYYEGRRDVEVVHEVYVNGVYVRTDIIRIPWPMLRASVKRKDADLRRQRKARGAKRK